MESSGRMGESPEHPSQVAWSGRLAIAGGVTQAKTLKIFITALSHLKMGLWVTVSEQGLAV